MNRISISIIIALLCSHTSAFSQVLLPNWPSANSYVRSFAFDTIHHRVFVSGNFTMLGNQPRSRLAAIDLQTGAVTSFQPDVNEGVYVLCLHDSVLYIGGMFTEVNGQPRQRLAAFNTNTLELLPWAPFVSGLPVRALAMDGDDLLVGGDLGTVDGVSRPSLAKFDMPSGTLSSWDAEVSGMVKSIQVQDDAIFLAGGYMLFSGVPRQVVAKLDRASGSLLAWNAHLIAGLGNSISIVDTILWVGGNWDIAQGSGQQRVAALTVSTAENACVVDEPDASVLSLCTGNDKVFIGGGFHMIGDEERVFAASISVDDCSLDTMDLGFVSGSPAYGIMTVGMHHNLLVAGGYFDLDGITHHNLAAWSLDELTVGIPEGEEEVPFRIWPNPCERELFLESPANDAASLEVTNILGAVLIAMPYRPRIDLSVLPAGIYCIRISGNNGEKLSTARVLKE